MWNISRIIAGKIVIPVISSLLIAGTLHAQDQDLFKVLNWNVLLSFDHGKAIDNGVEWINKQHADVVALQELNGQTDESFRELALRWGHENAVLLKEEGYPVGLSSRMPIEIMEKKIEGFQHGYLHVQTCGIHFFVIHLWPANDHESIEICKAVKKHIDAGDHVIVLGDFNAESPLDHQYFLTKPKLKSIVDYRVLNRFANAGLVDLTNKHDKNALVSNPSPIVIPEWHENLESVISIERRIDFILASKNLAGKSKASTIIRNKDLDRISDHYPVIALFNYIYN